MKERTKILPIFVYGTLMKGYRLHHVLKGLSMEKALLKGYRRIWSEKMPFPIIIENPGVLVEGELYSNIDQQLLDKLDRIEGEGSLYKRIKVPVEVNRTGKTREAYCYYPCKHLVHRVTKEEVNS